MLKKMIRKFVKTFRILIVRSFNLLDTEYYSRFNSLDSSSAGAIARHFVEIGAARKVVGIRCINVPRVFYHNIMKKIMGFAIYQHYVYNDIRIHNLDEIFTVPKSAPARKRNKNNFVEVLVPVYGAIDSVSRCLQSISTAKTSIDHSVCVIDDATPSTAEANEIKKLCTKYGFQYTRNETNFGFVKTANIGLRRTSGNSILLNSDTIVFDGWLEAFDSAVSSGVATVSCLSNNATIYSIPLETDSKYGEIEFSSQLAKNLRVLDQPPIEIPTAHGFCILITKQAKQIEGLFDEKSVGHGYGEENDYSLRLPKHGLTNVLTPKTLVFHEGSALFGSAVSNRQEKATRNLLQMWPDYLTDVQNFLAQYEMRELVAKARLQTIKLSNKETVVHFGHNLGGDVDVAIMGEIYNQDKNLENSIWIKPSEKEMDYSICVHDMGGLSQEFEIWGVTPEQLTSQLNQLALKAVVVHHQIGYKQLPEILTLLKQPYIFRAHDYNAFCPFNNFVTADGNYCGEPDDSACNKCIFDRESEFLDIQTWRIAKTQILIDATLVTAPSTDSKIRIEKYLKRTDVAVRQNERTYD
jgi:GT2 family glycosyltransferase